MLPEHFDHPDQNFRASSKGLTLELCRWIGKEPVKAILFEKMRDTMKKELEAELANVSGIAKPTRKIRSEQEKELEEEAVPETTGANTSEEAGSNNEKLKEKRSTMIEALSQTLQAMHKSGCITLLDAIEDVRVAVKNKVPLVRSLTLNWVTFCIETSNKATVLKLHKDYVPICMECLNDGTPEVRDASFSVLTAIAKESVISTFLKLCLKSLQEFVRLQTFNRSGFQQIQLDMEFLKSSLKEFIDEEAAISFLLKEVNNAAHERCLDPIPLEPPILDKLINAKLAKIKERSPNMQ